MVACVTSNGRIITNDKFGNVRILSQFYIETLKKRRKVAIMRSENLGSLEYEVHVLISHTRKYSNGHKVKVDTQHPPILCSGGP